VRFLYFFLLSGRYWCTAPPKVRFRESYSYLKYFTQWVHWSLGVLHIYYLFGRGGMYNYDSTSLIIVSLPPEGVMVVRLTRNCTVNLIYLFNNFYMILRRVMYQGHYLYFLCWWLISSANNSSLGKYIWRIPCRFERSKSLTLPKRLKFRQIA